MNNIDKNEELNKLDLNSMKMLFKIAMKASENAYAPFSEFKVGAALLCKNGVVYTGVNVENSSYGGTICAEQVAISKAVSEGNRDFTAIAIVGNDKKVMPCGICRQFMNEFEPSLLIITGDSVEELEIFTLQELLPNSFKL